MRVLAQVIFSQQCQPEPAATQALVHILRSSTSLAQEFVNIIGIAGINLELGRVAPEAGLPEPEDGRPDLSVYDADGTRRLLVENKFWTGLTEAQPTSYLNALPDAESALLFIVPAQRVHVVWNELTARCHNAGMILGQQEIGNQVISVPVNGRTLLITSWQHVLATLRHRANVDGLIEQECDIIQLKDLAEQMDQDALLPLRAEEVTDQAISMRLVNYIGLALNVVNLLNMQDNVSNLQNGTSDREFGRYFHYEEAFQIWLGVSLLAWKQYGVTPIWCHVNNDNFPNIHATRLALEQRPELTHHKFHITNDGLYISILLTLGAEENTMVQDIVTQVNRVAEILHAHHAE